MYIKSKRVNNAGAKFMFYTTDFLGLYRLFNGLAAHNIAARELS